MSKKNQSRNEQSPAKKNNPHPNQLLDKLDNWLEKNDKKIFYTLLFLSTLFSLLLFDVKVSEGGDDSSYIERAWVFLKEKQYPYFQGPGYPVFLSVFMKLFGFNVIALKFFSVICQFGFVFFTYKAFVKRIPYTVLFALIAFISCNSFIQYYSSQTFTETFFLFVQSICLFVIFKIIDRVNEKENWVDAFKKNYLLLLFFGLAFLILTVSKSIAFVAIPALLLYFILKKNYKQAVYMIVVYIVFRVVYQLTISSIYGENQTDQLDLMLRKDMYKPELGHEDFAGIVTRFFNNFHLYLSVHIYRIMNLRREVYTSIRTVPFISYLTVAAMLVAAFIGYRKNKFILLAAIYAITLSCGIFLGVQANNMQDRLIIIAIPFIFLTLFYLSYELGKRYPAVQYPLIIFSGIMLFITIGKSSIHAKENITTLKKNLGGNIYYGYTPDWVNFLEMSKYCADSLPDSAVVLSRKPNMSFLYGQGKKFAGQYWVTTTNADSVLMEWQHRKINYIILASIRMDPKKNNGNIINTIHRMAQPVVQKYPQKLKLIKTIGDSESSYLYQIVY